MQARHFLDQFDRIAELRSVTWTDREKVNLFAEFLEAQKVPLYEWSRFISAKAAAVKGRQ